MTDDEILDALALAEGAGYDTSAWTDAEIASWWQLVSLQADADETERSGQR